MNSQHGRVAAFSLACVVSVALTSCTGSPTGSTTAGQVTPSQSGGCKPTPITAGIPGVNAGAGSSPFWIGGVGSISGAPASLGTGRNKVVLVVSKSVAAHTVVTAQSLSGIGGLTFQLAGAKKTQAAVRLPSHSLGEPSGSVTPGFDYYPAYIQISRPGCYVVTASGPQGTTSVTIKAT